MIYLGTDIVCIPRIQHALERFGERFIRRVYTSAEQKDCGVQSSGFTDNGTVSKKAIAQLAGRWAAKEATAKALGTGWQGIRYTDIEIQRLASGAPAVCLHGAAAAVAARWGECQWQVSISHERDYCVAVVIALAPFCSNYAS